MAQIDLLTFLVQDSIAYAPTSLLCLFRTQLPDALCLPERIAAPANSAVSPSHPITGTGPGAAKAGRSGLNTLLDLSPWLSRMETLPGSKLLQREDITHTIFLRVRG